MLKKYNKLRSFSLVFAESFDAWRIIPRLMLIAYAFFVSNIYVWYKTIPTYVQEKCDAAVLQIFIDHKMDVDEAKKLSCTVENVVGGPTSSQTLFVTTVVGLTSIIFGFYTNSGRRWDYGMPRDLHGYDGMQMAAESPPQTNSPTSSG